ncbi:MAG: hypothetical protein JSW52_10365 [Candidatus Coatesbacteria bacterium]|nr:MAG: hypothetical protein JSW52_10365 [Candidatus Coatesbacteria bacterium]
MRTLCVLLTLAFTFPVSATDWGHLGDFPCPEVANEERGFGLAWRDSEVFVACWNAEATPPWYTNLFVYDESGNYQGEHFPTELTDIDISGLDWKSDADHGGMGWYAGGRQEPTIYLIADDGSSYDSFAGPSNFDRIYGVAHNPDDDMFYTSDFITGWVGWGDLDGSGAVSSWNQENPGITYNSMKYVPGTGTDYLFAIYRGELDTWIHEVHIFSLDGSGVPNDIYVPDQIIDFGNYFYYLGDFDWDGEHMWLLDQNKGGGDATLDYVAKIALTGFSPDTNIVPTSLGHIKAQFK